MPADSLILGFILIAGAAAVLAVTVLVAGSLTPGYSQWADTVSRLGSPGQPWAWAARIALVTSGLLVLTAGASLRGRFRGSPFVAISGAATALAGLVAKTPAGSPATLGSRIHVVAALAGGSMLVAAMATDALTSPCDRDRWVSAAAVVVALVTAGMFGLSRGRPWCGLLERTLMATDLAWLLFRSRRRSFF